MNVSAAQMRIDMLSVDERRTLERLAVARAITPDVARVVLDVPPEQLDDLPLLRRAGWDDSGNTFVLEPGLRSALLAGARNPAELAGLHAALASHHREQGHDFDTLFHRMADPAQRETALAELQRRFDERLAAFDVGGAHDLLRLLEDAAVDLDMLEQLRPRLARRARGLRERDITTTYFPRPFEAAAWDSLRADGQRWILQLHAPGGMGKTMFVSNLVGRLCPAAEIPVAKIDFDYVAHLVESTQEPWRLLLLVARQLSEQLEDDPFQTLLRSWGRYESRVLSVRRREDLPIPGVDTEQIRGAQDVPRLFRAILAERRGTEPTVIVLDTVENLLHTEDTAAMELLQELGKVRKEVPGLHVVVAGRFDLAGREVTGGGGTVPRLSGFREEYVGEEAETGEIAGAPVERGRQCLTLAVPPFADEHAKEYIERRGVRPDSEHGKAIVELAGGNPLKLALLADEVTGADPPSVEELRRIRSIELHHLVKRVIDRIADPRVQWLVRWGAIPHVLQREFARDVLWKLLDEQLDGIRAWDDPSRDALGHMGRGMARYDVGDWPRDFDQAWSKLVSYASASSWIRPVPEVPGGFSFHPETRDPIRGLLRAEHQAIYHELHRRALDYWRKLARGTGAVRQAALRAAVFHCFEPWHGRGDPTAAFVELLDEAGDDVALRAVLAAEVLDVERRARRRDREDLEPPPRAALARAHTELAKEAVAAIEGGEDRSAQLERHLQLADMSEGMRLVTRARAALAEGQAQRARDLLAAARQRGDEIESATLQWIQLQVASFSHDLDEMAAIVKAAVGTALGAKASNALAVERLAREQLDRAAELFDEIGDAVGSARALLGMGEYRAALARVEGETGDRAAIARAEAHLALFEPEEVLARTALGEIARRGGEPSGAALLARANAMLGRYNQALGGIEAQLTSQDALAGIEAPTAARMYLDRDDPLAALRILDTLPTGLAPELAARAAILRAEAVARDGKFANAIEGLDALPMADLPLSLRVEAVVTTAQITGFDDRACARLQKLLAEASRPGWRLELLGGLARVGTPRAAPRDYETLLDLTKLHDATALRLRLARADLLRICHRGKKAGALLTSSLHSARGIAVRFVEHAVDRLDRRPDGLYGTTRRPTGEVANLFAADDSARRFGPGFPGRRGMGPLVAIFEEKRLEAARSAARVEAARREAERVVAVLVENVRREAVSDVVYFQRFDASRVEAVRISPTDSPKPVDSPVDLERGAIPGPWGVVPEHSHAPFPVDALEALTKDWERACEQLGSYLQTFRPERSSELVIQPGTPDRAWVPWQMGTVGHLPLHGIRRAHPGSALSETASGRVVLVEQSQKNALFTAKAMHASWRRVGIDVLQQTSVSWDVLPALLDSSRAGILHVIGSIEQRRGGSLFLDMTGDHKAAIGSAHVARALAGADRPVLVILHSPWPGSDTEAVHQLFLRERFVWEIFRENHDANILCAGLTARLKDVERHCDLLAEAVTSSPLKTVVARLQQSGGAPKSLADRLGLAATLYSQAPDLRYVR